MFSPWRYSKAEGWKELNSLLATTDKDNWEEELFECGFGTEPTLELGVAEKFNVEIYQKIQDGDFIAYTEGGKPLEIPRAIDIKDEFLAVVNVAGVCHEVALPKLPDLISFLSDIVPICREARQSSIETVKQAE